MDNEINLKINELVSGLKAAQTKDDLNRSLRDWKSLTDFDWYLFALSRSKSMQESEHEIFTNYPIEWMQRYQAEKLFQQDPVVKYVRHHQSAIFWDSFWDLDGYNSPEQLDILRQAAKYGLVHGCSIPCNSYNHFAVFSVASATADKVSKMNDYLPYIYFYSNQLLESVLRINSMANEDDLFKTLTGREIECLFWASEGKTAWEISKILGISERTVVFHFGNVTEKLNASSRQHAISKAILFGLVKPSI